MKRAVEELQNEYGQDRILLDMNDQYYNMREKIEPVIEIVNIAKQAMENLGIEPKISPIRGGTDGSLTVLHGASDAKHLYRRGKLPRQI